MVQISGQYGNVIRITTSIAVSAGNFLIVGQIGGIAADDVSAGEVGNAIMYGIFRMRKRANSIAINPGDRLYSANGLGTVNGSPAVGHTVFVGYAVTPSAANSSDEVSVFLAREGAGA